MNDRWLALSNRRELAQKVVVAKKCRLVLRLGGVASCVVVAQLRPPRSALSGAQSVTSVQGLFLLGRNQALVRLLAPAVRDLGRRQRFPRCGYFARLLAAMWWHGAVFQ
jgi:hypothetical protein